MTASALWQISVRADAAREDQIVARLEEELPVGVATYRDADTGALTISAYLAKLEAAPLRLRRSLAEALELSLRAIAIKRLPRQNWADSWRRHFKPIQIGKHLLIKPTWSRRRAQPGQRVVVLDPGLSFGTGQHATTSFCLTQVAGGRKRKESQSFLDVGTGSGILAIAAAKLGYSPIEAFDFDPEAVRSAESNARKNRVDNKVVVRLADLTALPSRPVRQFDLICANITYDLLSAEAGKLAGLLAPGGRLVAAGILEEQFQIVTKSFQRFGLTLRASERNNIWRSGQFAFQSVVQRRKGSIEGKCL